MYRINSFHAITFLAIACVVSAGCSHSSTPAPGEAAATQAATTSALQSTVTKVQSNSALSDGQKATLIAGAQRRLGMRPGVMPNQ